MKLYTFFRSSASFRVRIALNHKGLKYEHDDEGGIAWSRHWIAEGFQMMEAFLEQERKHGKYCFRDQVTMADCCLVPQVFNAILYKCDLKPYPAVMRIHEACMKLDSFVLAQPSKQTDAA